MFFFFSLSLKILTQCGLFSGKYGSTLKSSLFLVDASS